MKTFFLFFSVIFSFQASFAQSSRYTVCEANKEDVIIKGVLKDYNSLDVSKGVTMIINGESKQIIPSLFSSLFIDQDQFYAFKLENNDFVFLKLENEKNSIKLFSYMHNSISFEEEAMIEEDVEIIYYFTINDKLILLTEDNFIDELNTISGSVNIEGSLHYYDIPKAFNQL